MTDKIENNSVNLEDYVSTENMIPDKGGLCLASNVPDGKSVKYQKGDILISNIRPYFKKIWFADRNGGCSPDVMCIRANEDVDNLFLFYLLSQQSFFDYVMTGTNGCKMPRGDRKQIMQWSINIPSEKKDQQKIADILSSLDSKIETNRAICSRLEELAQAIFKSWFIDFEPFKDEEFVEDEFGKRPKGWKCYHFEDFITESKEKVGSSDVAEYSITNTGIWPREAKFNKSLSANSSKNKKIEKGDLGFGMSRAILNWGVMEDEVGGVSSAYNIYKVNQELVESLYLKMFISNKLPYFSTLIRPAAREGQSIDKGALMSKCIYVPNESIWKKYLKIHNEIKDNILNKQQESSRLSSLRDTLLPRLMSGELEPKDIRI